MAAQTTLTREARPLPKRRRLTAPQPHPPPAPVPVALPKSPAAAVCTSCHRASTLLPGTGAVQILLCARCAAPTCTVCSRTCTAALPSPPPTPHLTWSPTPAATPAGSPVHSPRRPALVLNFNNVNVPNASVNGTGTPGGGKRKKPRDDDQDESTPRREDGGYGASPGCGRAICRDCCFESPQESTTTCYDCYGR